MNESGMLEPLAIVIMAREEAQVLASTLTRLSGMITPGDEVHVVADNCLDATAQVAREGGAIVHERRGGGWLNKGAALNWWLERTRDKSDPLGIVILDADSIPATGFLDCIRHRLAQGQRVVQARIEPRLCSDSRVAYLAAFSEVIEHRLADRLRSRLGWPVRLRGTGMAFHRADLESVGPRLKTLVEDVELTLLVAANGVAIHYAHETHVIDPKPEDKQGATRQRARWLRGQIQVLKHHPKAIMRLLGKGPAGWSLLSSTLLRPKTFFIPIKVATLGVVTLLAWMGSAAWMLLALPLGLWLIFDLGLLLAGLRYAPPGQSLWRIPLLLPLYMAMWLRGLLLSLVNGNGWLRARKPASDDGVLESVRGS